MTIITNINNGDTGLVARIAINDNFDNLNNDKAEVHTGKTAAPTSTDDTGSGYGVSDIWVDETNDKAYICVDNTSSAAVWKNVSKETLSEMTGDSDDLTEGSNKLFMTTTERSKLSGIEANATADQTGSEIKTLYEAESDTNAFTDSEKSKLAGIESGATADQSAGEIKTAYESNLDTNAYTDSEKAKLGYISVTQAVDLDQMETDIAALANGMVYQGNWDASVGTFPGGGSAKTGWFYTVSVGGTVDSVTFSVGDRLIAITDNASTATYSSNWTKLDATDEVSSVAGKTGNVTLDADDVSETATKKWLSDTEQDKLSNIESNADVTDAVNIASALNGSSTKTTPVDADLFGLLDSAATFVLKKVTRASIKATLKTYFDGLYNNYSHPNHTGDVTSSGDGATTISDEAVTNAKLSHVDTNTIKGRTTAGTGDVEDLTPAQVRTMINVEDGSEANNISDVNATDLTDGGDSTLHYHASDRDRSNHTGTQTLSTISDAGTAASQDVGTGSGNVPQLDGSGKLPESVIPSISISEFLGNFADTSAALADAGVQASERGDWFTVNTNGGETYFVITDAPTTTGHIEKAKTPTSAVSSVNSKTGAVVIDPDDLDDTATTNKFTNASDISKLAGIESNADVTDAGNVGASISGAGTKATPVDADKVGLIDSADSNNLKGLTWANIKANLKTYFDSLTTTFTNKTISFSSNTLTNVMSTTTAQSVTAGIKKTFQANATNAGLRLSGVTANPSTLVAGDKWYRSDTEKMMYRGASVARALVAEALAQTLTNKTIALGSNTISGTKSQFNTACTDGVFTYQDMILTSCLTGAIQTVADGDYTILLKAPHAMTITETTTKSGSGTCTATFKINTTALGGTANSVSTTEQSQAHASSNSVSAGDDIVITISSNSSCEDMNFTIKYTTTLSNMIS